jgi:hypothetical protein
MSDVERLRAAAGGGGVQPPRCYPLKVCAICNAAFAMACRMRAGADRAPLPAGPIKTT